MKNLIFLLVALLFFTNCSKKAEENNQPRIDFQELNIGELHNQLVSKAYKRVGSATRSLKYRVLNETEFRDLVIKEFSDIDYDPTPIGYTLPEYIELSVEQADYLANYSYDITQTNYEYVYPNAIPYVERIIAALENASDLTAIYSSLEQIRISAQNSLSPQDYDVVYGTIEISKSSAYLWAPLEMGGYDLYQKTFSGTMQPLSAWSWKRALVADASSSATYFLRMGGMLALGLATPGSNVAILGGWAVTAGIGSAMGGLSTQ